MIYESFHKIQQVIISILVAHSCLLAAAYAEEPKAKAQIEDSSKTAKTESPFKIQQGKGPVYIKSDSVSLKANERVFIYTGNVEVVQDDLTLTSDTLEGTYTEKNEIKSLTARSNVVIIKGDSIRANSEEAHYEAASDTLTLTKNPELEQNGSVLTADTIRIFLEEDRSVAEGAVRVKLVTAEDKKDGSDRGRSGLSKLKS